MPHSTISVLDPWISALDNALKTLSGAGTASRAAPDAAPTDLDALTPEQRRLSASLMRVNHVGEVCAQALYNGQALATSNEALRDSFQRAAREETDHLAWTQQRLRELNARPSVLNPFWYGASFAMGYLAGRTSDRLSLGFVVETERQVEEHLASHLVRLPEADHASRAIVAQMKDDEARHANDAEAAGALPLPQPVRRLMRAVAKVMTTTAHRI
jgi:ubiquinone biosynthesis monooxygenase Coq7